MRRNNKTAACFVCGLCLLLAGCIAGNDILRVIGCTFILASLMFR